MKKILYLFMLPVILVACGTTEKPQEEVNPLLLEFNTPFGVPPFEQISSEHYLPTYKAALAEHMEDINAIINNSEPADFENTIVAYDRAGKLLSRISPVFGGLRGAHSNPE